MSEEYESVCLVKPEVFVYRIPPLTTNKGHKASEWNLDNPDWTGRMRLVSIGKKLELRLEDKSGALYAKAPIDNYPGKSIEPVTDSSRYFVIRLMNDSGQTAFVGLGFLDRGDSFDLNVSLQDHFKYLEKAAEIEQQSVSAPAGPKLDLGFKEGQTITINIGKKKDGSTTPRPRPAPSASGGGFPLLPPPPAGGQVARPRGTVAAPTSSSQPQSSSAPQPHETRRQRQHMEQRLGLQMNRLVVAMSARQRPVAAEPSGTCIARLNKDYMKLMTDPIDGIIVAMKPENILEWHYVLLGSPDTPYFGGVYHGRLVFQPDFPWKPPAIYMDTPSGRFVVGHRLCLSISDYHPESWNPGWSVGSILLGVQSFMNEEDRAVGTVSPAPSRAIREELAAKSLDYNRRNKVFCELFPELLQETDDEPQGNNRKRARPQSTGGTDEVRASLSKPTCQVPKVAKRSTRGSVPEVVQLD